MSKIIEFPKKHMNIEVQVVDQEKIEQSASAVIMYLNGLHVSEFANWEEIANSLIIAFVNASQKANIEPEEAMEMLRSVNIKDIEDFNG
mgnify:CR=1 FL=1|tara:strand:+ start:26 stop:292 length:267 start_codon:yes stop_codon:yes gene_type:complete